MEHLVRGIVLVQEKREQGKIIMSEELENISSMTSGFFIYVKSISKTKLFGILFLVTLLSFFTLAETFLLALWKSGTTAVPDLYYSIGYLLLSFFYCFFNFGYYSFSCFCWMSISNKYFVKVIRRMMNTSMNWFLKNPYYRLIHRMGRIQSLMDYELSNFISGMLLHGSFLIGTFFLMIMILPYKIIPLLFLFCTILGILIIRLLIKFFKAAFEIERLKILRRSTSIGITFDLLNMAYDLRVSDKLDTYGEFYSCCSNNYQLALSYANNFSERWLGSRLAFLLYLYLASIFLMVIGYTCLIDEESLRKDGWKLALFMSLGHKIIANTENFICYFVKSSKIGIFVSQTIQYLNTTKIDDELRQDRINKEVQNPKLEKDLEKEISFGFSKKKFLMRNICSKVELGALNTNTIFGEKFTLSRKWKKNFRKFQPSADYRRKNSITRRTKKSFIKSLSRFL